MPKPYSQLSVESKNKLSNTLLRLHKNGITVKQALAMSDLELKQSLGSKINLRTKKGQKSMNGLRRNIRQIQFDQNRKEMVSNESLNYYVKQKYRGKGLSREKSRLRKTSGINIFFDISEKVQTKFNLTQKQSYTRTRNILILARTNYRKLGKKEKELLSYFS